MQKIVDCKNNPAELENLKKKKTYESVHTCMCVCMHVFMHA